MKNATVYVYDGDDEPQDSSIYVEGIEKLLENIKK